MPADAPPPQAPLQPAGVRLKLIMPEDGQPQQQSSNPISIRGGSREPEHESSGSPQRPSYSPVTPTLSHTSLAQDDDRVELPPSQFMDEPDPVPIDLDDNPDAMALRATLSVLQLQRQQALRDMRDLDKMKQAAMRDPEQFVQDLSEGKLTGVQRDSVEVDGVESSEHETPASGGSKFGRFPSAQNVMRCPPVEWAKYHVVGEGLDRIHEVQQHYPGYTEDMQGRADQPLPQTVAAPYRPFMDRLDGPRAAPKPRASEP